MRFPRLRRLVAIALIVGGTVALAPVGEASAFELRSTRDNSLQPGWKVDRSALSAVKRRTVADRSRAVAAYRQVTQRRPVFVDIVDGVPRFRRIVTGRRTTVAVVVPSPGVRAEVSALSAQVAALEDAIYALKTALPQPKPRPKAAERPRIQPKVILLDDRPLPDVTVYRGLERGL